MLGPGKAHEHTDEELAADEVGGELLAAIQFPAWSHVRSAGMDHALLAAAELGGLAAINILLRQANLPPVDCRTQPS